jgi:hypothetical protein
LEKAMGSATGKEMERGMDWVMATGSDSVKARD